MASKELLLENENPGASTGFSYTWSIQNFSHCTLHYKEYIDSPTFEVKFLNCSKWYMRLYPKGSKKYGYLSVFLYKTETKLLPCKFSLSIRTSTGQFKGTAEAFHGSTVREGYCNFLCRKKLDDTDGYLENDTLTLRCRMWNNGTDLVPEHYYAYTKIKTAKVNYTWNLSLRTLSNDECSSEHFREVSLYNSKVPILKLHALHGRRCSKDGLHFGLAIPNMKDYVFIKCAVYIFDVNGSRLQMAKGKHLFEFTSKIPVHFFPTLTKHELYKNDRLYLPNGKLTSQWELSFSTNNNDLEIVEIGRTEDLRLNSNPSNVILNGYEIWKENFGKFFLEETYSDVTVRTIKRQYPVHKSILFAQSKVFAKMFDHDTKERQTGEILIDDLEDDIVFQTLKFIYNPNSLGEIDSFTAQKLFEVADRYEIEALLLICSNRLKQCLDISNVCHVLVLAHMHEDEELKSSAKDFIAAHARDVLKSEEWSEAKKCIYNAPLMIETLEWLNNNNPLLMEL